MQDQILPLAEKLIAVPSVSGNMQSLRDVLGVAAMTLGDLPFQDYEDAGIPSLLYYNHNTAPSKFKVILNAHLDVVPGKVDQYTSRIDGDKLYGRGSYDMKAAAAVEIMVFKELAEQVPYALGLQLVTDEETGGFHGVKHQVEKGVQTEFVMVGETSSDFAIGIKSKGIIWVRITFTGKSAHGAYVWNGDNALWKAHEFLAKARKEFAIPVKEEWVTTINLASIETPNDTPNKVPDAATVALDIRFIPEDSKRVHDVLTSLLPPGASIEFLVDESSRDTHADDPYVKKLEGIIVSKFSKPAHVIGKHGGTDLRHFPNTPGVEMGPVGFGPHTDEEWVSIAALTTYYEILKEFLLSVE